MVGGDLRLLTARGEKVANDAKQGGADLCVIEPQERSRHARRGLSRVVDFSPGEENASEEAYNNAVCVQGRVIPPVVRLWKCRQRR